MYIYNILINILCILFLHNYFAVNYDNFLVYVQYNNSTLKFYETSLKHLSNSFITTLLKIIKPQDLF